ncbi:hypothetical protein JS73_06265 [Synergistes jonesii]|uniref:Uncharacterized protein n=1 Tax=Synergistes jonesii TaxID=2754 RepID=A0A073IS75_9BACT|nr:helix-turn-helix domain-containing protein [Synergistes jonesii]KEJ92405.1 hypothetical protein EH55_04065 [Synergistes jonesii]OFB62306.1 hypothetical protein JS72_08825 [Synergistes jonesii]OFB62995.1 hypothetical protein JS73_06265 [Synergistes jonesii]OFB63621.1 hypothetical protein JS79_06790 [Synergistes jonesii]OFB67787.1 hypothetical protein JS78_06275 [Synergistes jonesii]
MKKAGLYSEIQKLKKLGFKKNSVANQLKINWRTVDRYWEIPVERLENPPSYTRRNRKLDEHRDAVLNMLRDYPAISAAQVCNWLKDSCGKGYSLRTVSRFIKELREAHNITKKSAPQPNDPHQTKNAEAGYLEENLSAKPSKRMAKSELTKQLLFDAATRLFQKKVFMLQVWKILPPQRALLSVLFIIISNAKKTLYIFGQINLMRSIIGIIKKRSMIRVQEMQWICCAASANCLLMYTATGEVNLHPLHILI